MYAGSSGIFGFATGIALSGSMAGYVLATPAQAAIEAVGWRATLGGYLVLVLALVPLVLRVYPVRLGRGGTSAPAAGSGRRVGAIVRSFPFWALAFVFVNAPLVGYLVTVQHVLYFDGLGFPVQEAAAMLAVGGVLSTSGRALAGLLADRFGAPAAGLVSLTLSLVGTLCLIGLEAWPTRLLAYAYVALVFLPLGTRATIVALLVRRIAPPHRFAAVFGWLVLGNSLGAGLGPLLSGALYDVTGSYLVIYVTAGVLLAATLGALLAFLLTTRETPPPSIR